MKASHANTKITGIFVLVLGLLSLLGCGAGGGGAAGGNNNAAVNQQDLLNRINQQFPFTPNQPLDVIFACQRRNSQLLYTFDFNSNGSFDLYSTLNNNQDIMVSGTYSYQNDELHMLSQNNFLPLDERSINIESLFGMLYRFQTSNMDCIAMGHRYNDPMREFSTTVNYRCPIINIMAASDENNAIEFVHRNMPFNLAVPGSAFRQRDININGATQPSILRGYGIYRRSGDNFYIYFNNQFNDVNVLSGTFQNGDLAISVDQLEPAAGNCVL